MSELPAISETRRERRASGAEAQNLGFPPWPASLVSPVRGHKDSSLALPYGSVEPENVGPTGPARSNEIYFSFLFVSFTYISFQKFQNHVITQRRATSYGDVQNSIL